MVYLDNSATTPIAPEVLEAMLPYFEEEYGNASSVYSLGTRARVALEDARGTVANFIGADAREITFTSSGTEANNAAIKGTAFANAIKGSPIDQQHFVTSAAEHHAVLEPMEFLGEMGASVDVVGVNAHGQLHMDQMESRLQERTSLVSIMTVNNEVGAINDLDSIVKTVRQHSPKALVHTDAVQALGVMRIDTHAMGVDMLTLSAHKIHGPKGIGLLYTRSGIKLEPLHHGGAQERNRRGGTEPVALAAGFAKAVELLEVQWDERLNHIKSLRAYLLHELHSVPELAFNSLLDDTCSPAIVSFTFDPVTRAKLDAEALLFRFDLEGVAVSNGSACTSGSLQPSHVLKAMGKGDDIASKSIRVSLSGYTQREDIDKFIVALKKIIR